MVKKFEIVQETNGLTIKPVSFFRLKFHDLSDHEELKFGSKFSFHLCAARRLAETASYVRRQDLDNGVNRCLPIVSAYKAQSCE